MVFNTFLGKSNYSFVWQRQNFTFIEFFQKWYVLTRTLKVVLGSDRTRYWIYYYQINVERVFFLFETNYKNTAAVQIRARTPSVSKRRTISHANTTSLVSIDRVLRLRSKYVYGFKIRERFLTTDSSASDTVFSDRESKRISPGNSHFPCTRPRQIQSPNLLLWDVRL